MSARSSSASRIRACFALDASEMRVFSVLEGGGTFVVVGGGRSSRSSLTGASSSSSRSLEGVAELSAPPDASVDGTADSTASSSDESVSEGSGRATAIRGLRVVHREARPPEGRARRGIGWRGNPANAITTVGRVSSENVRPRVFPSPNGAVRRFSGQRPKGSKSSSLVGRGAGRATFLVSFSSPRVTGTSKVFPAR